MPQAAAMLMPVLLVMDLLGMAALRKHFDRKLIRFLVPFGLLGTLVGTFSFKLLDARMVAGLVGVFTLLNLSKWVPYAWLGLLDMRSMATSVALLPFAPIGVWIGVRLAHRIKPLLFYRLVYVGMFLTGVKLVWDGFFGR